MAGESKITTDHNEIQKWVEERKGVPATVQTTKKGGEIGIIRVMFPETGQGKNLQKISWDEFFNQFEKHNLKFLYQEKTKDGELSRFFKFIRR